MGEVPLEEWAAWALRFFCLFERVRVLSIFSSVDFRDGYFWRAVSRSS